jgi:outer membrane protein assembly factor BamB
MRRYWRGPRRIAKAVWCTGLLAAAMVSAASPSRAQTPVAPDFRDDQFSVAYQINPAHTGAITFDVPFQPPLTLRWSQKADGPLSYPLIARGKIFIYVSYFPTESHRHAGRLYALDQQTGAAVWQLPVAATYGEAGIAYDQGRVFLVTFDGALSAYHADTGAPAWTLQLPGQAFADTPPTASNGIVYAVGTGTGGALYAVDEATGTLLWQRPVENGVGSSPAVSGDGVYLSYPCRIYKFNPLTGDQIRRFGRSTISCKGGSGTTPVYYRGRLFVTDSADVASHQAAIFNPNDGRITGTFGSTTSISGPALQGGAGYYLDGGKLAAFDIAAGKTLWSVGDGAFALGPLVVNGAVYVLSRFGTLYAIDRRTGRAIWEADGGPNAALIDSAGPVTGMAAGDGLLVVPAGRILAAFGAGPDK